MVIGKTRAFLIGDLRTQLLHSRLQCRSATMTPPSDWCCNSSGYDIGIDSSGSLVHLPSTLLHLLRLLSLLLRCECCSFSNGEYVKAGLAKQDHWCFNATYEQYSVSAWDELKHIQQAIAFLVIHQKPKKTLGEISHDVCLVMTSMGHKASPQMDLQDMLVVLSVVLVTYLNMLVENFSLEALLGRLRKVQFKRHFSQSSKFCLGSEGSLHTVVSDKEYGIITNCLAMNLGEQPNLPLPFRDINSDNSDTIRLLADKVDMTSQVFL
ncbi:unnamed protein product [Lactuca saligna]|uniref:Dilute domain-containing protein n=1 Tax=Lactuca saligna TaxID=75948 RepID=A0AA35VWD1_LACSI|nr:unnamed protein product [Lactuca saligna]